MTNPVPETFSSSADYPAASTPSRVATSRISEPAFSPLGKEAKDFVFLSKAKNLPPWAKKLKDPTWTDTPIASFKYVDDSANVEKLNLRAEPQVESAEGTLKKLYPKKTNELLEHIATKAKQRGMLVNEAKTTLMCFSAAISFKTSTEISFQGVQVNGQREVKLLGVTLDEKCSFAKHAITVKNKLRAKLWALAKLKKAGMKETDLVRTYKNLIRPAAEHAVPAWHSMLSAEQSEWIERQQTQSLKNIFGMGISAEKMRKKAGLPLLSTRREEACLKFAKKSIVNKRTEGWFTERQTPRYARRNSVTYNTYHEPIAQTDRFRSSPKNYLRRLLNRNL